MTNGPATSCANCSGCSTRSMSKSTSEPSQRRSCRMTKIEATHPPITCLYAGQARASTESVCFCICKASRAGRLSSAHCRRGRGQSATIITTSRVVNGDTTDTTTRTRSHGAHVRYPPLVHLPFTCGSLPLARHAGVLTLYLLLRAVLQLECDHRWLTWSLLLLIRRGHVLISQYMVRMVCGYARLWLAASEAVDSDDELIDCAAPHIIGVVNKGLLTGFSPLTAPSTTSQRRTEHGVLKVEENACTPWLS